MRLLLCRCLTIHVTTVVLRRHHFILQECDGVAFCYQFLWRYFHGTVEKEQAGNIFIFGESTNLADSSLPNASTCAALGKINCFNANLFLLSCFPLTPTEKSHAMASLTCFHPKIVNGKCLMVVVFGIVT